MDITKKSTTFRINDTLYYKINYMADNERRSINNMMEYLLFKSVEEFESKFGEIVVDENELYEK